MQEETVQPGGESSSADKPAEQLLAEALATIAQQKDTLLRTLADAENARKRFQADAANAQKYALERFAENLLPVMDSLEAALKSKDVSGVELTQRQLKAALEKAAVRDIEPRPGERFDPYRHQAMAAVEAQADPNTVVAVMQKGYLLHDRVLRPALVTVAKSAADPISDKDLD
jgi:molecular chaperone GrpE